MVNIKKKFTFKLILFLGLFTIYSCETEQSKDAEDKVHSVDSIATMSSDIPQDDTLMQLKDDPNVQVFDIDACTSPAGLSIVFWGPSDIEGQYYFFDDNRVINRFYNEFALAGTWSMEDQLITIVYDTKYYRKGVGAPIPIEGGVPGNYIPQYEKYEYLTQEILETEIYFWDEIIQEIKDETGFYEIVAHHLDSSIFSNLTHLQLDVEN